MTSPIMILSQYDWRDPTSWSGIPYNIARAAGNLREDIILCGPLSSGLLNYPLKGVELIRNSVYSLRKYSRVREPSITKSYAAEIHQAIARFKPRALLSLSSLPIAHVRSEVPIFLWTGSTWGLMSNYYPEFQDLSTRARKTAEDCEIRAILNCTGSIAASNWAKTSIIEDYGAPYDSCIVSPWGAWPPVDKVTFGEIENRSSSLRLLTVGRPWGRKGMSDAIKLTKMINHMGHPATLDIVGSLPPSSEVIPGFIRIHGWLDKSSPVDALKLDRLYRESSYLIALSHAEAYGQVVNEAAAYALPSIVADTGGLGDSVRVYSLGLVASVPFEPSSVASWILHLLHSDGSYRELCQSVQETFYKSLSWHATVGRTLNFIDSRVIDGRTPLIDLRSAGLPDRIDHVGIGEKSAEYSRNRGNQD